MIIVCCGYGQPVVTYQECVEKNVVYQFFHKCLIHLMTVVNRQHGGEPGCRDPDATAIGSSASTFSMLSYRFAKVTERSDMSTFSRYSAILSAI